MEHFYSFPDLVNYHAPIFMDGWQMSGEYVTLLAEAPFTLDSTWKLIWDQKVSFVVTILTTEAKVSWSCLLKYIDSHKYSLPNFFYFFIQDDLGTLSDAKTFGDHDVGLYNEDILPDYTIRTLKVHLFFLLQSLSQFWGQSNMIKQIE